MLILFEVILVLADAQDLLIDFVPPTPDDGDTINASSVFVNVSVTSANETSAFIDWNRSLVAWYTFDERNDTAVFDNSTYGRDGLIGGNATNASFGKRGIGFAFDGDDDYITIGTGSDFSDVCLNGCTFSAWVNGSSGISSSGGTIVARWDNGADSLFFFRYNTLNRVYFQIDDDGAGGITVMRWVIQFNLIPGSMLSEYIIQPIPWFILTAV